MGTFATGTLEHLRGAPIDIVVDGGASRCRLAAFDACGERLASVAVDGHASLSLGVAEAALNIARGLTALRGALGRCAGGQVPPTIDAPGAFDSPLVSLMAEEWPTRLTLGLAGSLRPALRDALRAALPARTSAHIVTDGHAQLLGASAGAAGTCLAVGTGSVVHWLDEHGAAGMGGGWGFPVGDEASAAWLGFRLLQEHVAARDRGEPPSALGAALESITGAGVAELQAWTTRSRSTDFGRLATLVTVHAACGDALATRLLEEGATRCEAMFAFAPRGLPRYLVGGLAATYAPLLRARGLTPSAAAGDALDGLRHVARAGRRR